MKPEETPEAASPETPEGVDLMKGVNELKQTFEPEEEVPAPPAESLGSKALPEEDEL